MISRIGIFSLLTTLSFFLVRYAAAMPSLPNDIVRNQILKTALEQSTSPSRDWAIEQRDCAGFIRYVFRKSLRSREPIWFDSKGRSQFFATAEELIYNNFIRISGAPDGESLKTGDVFAYYWPEKKPEDRWHLMMVLKSPLSSNRDALVIYHNGDKGFKAQIRKLWLAELETPAMTEWQPRVGNSHFMGVYRWKGFR